MLQSNNAALLGPGALDISGFDSSFSSGQKLRQEYESRQASKALNELMGIEDFNERIAKARTHKYAGSIVPELQKYEEARQKAALENLGASADIQKTYSETGKLGAETGKIGAETQGEQLKTATGIKDYISAAAVSQNAKAFALSIGELFKNQLLTSAQTEGLLSLVNSDPASAAQVLQAMAMQNPEIAKTFMPKPQVLDGKDAAYLYSTNGFTGTSNAPDARIAYGVSPDNQLDNDTSRFNNAASIDGRREGYLIQAETSENNSQRSLQGTMYGADQGLAGRIYSADSTAATNAETTAVNWYKAKTGAATDAANAESKRIAANKTGASGGKPRPVAATKEMSKHLTNIKNNAHTMRNTATWVKRLASGEFSLGAVANMGNAAANRTGVNGLGQNPALYAEFKANMTKLASDALRLNTGVQTDMDYKRALEEMQAGTYIPRNNKTAIALLNKISQDFESKNKAEYAAYADYKREYDGVVLPAYGAGSKTPAKTKSKSKGSSIIGGILGGK